MTPQDKKKKKRFQTQKTLMKIFIFILPKKQK